MQRSHKPWGSEDEAADVRALNEIIEGATLDPSGRATYTLVLQWICGTVGVDAWFGAEEDDQEYAEQEPEPIETLNAILRRLGESELEESAHQTHPFLPTLPLAPAHDFPTIAVYDAAGCARTAETLSARWSELDEDEIEVAGPMLRLLERRRYDDVLIVFSY